MRGVVSLAAALSLPETLGNGRPFAQRSLIIFLTFCVILVALVLQGLTLPALIRYLGLSTGEDREEAMRARRLLAEEAIGYLQQERSGDDPERAHASADMLHYFEHQLQSAVGRLEAERQAEGFDLVTETARVQRRTAVRLRDAGEIGDEVMNRLLGELDLTEARQRSRR